MQFIFHIDNMQLSDLYAQSCSVCALICIKYANIMCIVHEHVQNMQKKSKNMDCTCKMCWKYTWNMLNTCYYSRNISRCAIMLKRQVLCSQLQNIDLQTWARCRYLICVTFLHSAQKPHLHTLFNSYLIRVYTKVLGFAKHQAKTSYKIRLHGPSLLLYTQKYAIK